MAKIPFERTYTQSYLYKAGIRFDFNVVDTICQRKLGLSFYLATLGVVLLFCLPIGITSDHLSEIENVRRTSSLKVLGQLLGYAALMLLLAYMIFYLGRLGFYLRLRSKLRSDPAPIAVEAYAVVCLDKKTRFSDYLLFYLSRFMGHDGNSFCRFAVVYKEIGTAQPRFFLTAAVSGRKLCFVPDHVGQVFPHRRKSSWYSLDDKSAYQTASRRKPIVGQALVSSGDLSAQGPEFDKKQP